jgi:hypothetical protein
MAELPPPFFSEPARALHVEADDEAFTGPGRLGRETAAATIARDDRAMADTLGRAWRSGAPDEMLSGLLVTYASAHELDESEVKAIASATRFAATVPQQARVNEVKLLGEVAPRIAEPLGQALARAQNDEEPCWCASCIAATASLN